jgi:hypothetical protein
MRGLFVRRLLVRGLLVGAGAGAGAALVWAAPAAAQANPAGID